MCGVRSHTRSTGANGREQWEAGAYSEAGRKHSFTGKQNQLKTCLKAFYILYFL